MKKSSQSNSFIKKSLRKAGIFPVRTTNKNGARVWTVGENEYPSLRAIVESLKAKKENQDVQ